VAAQKHFGRKVPGSVPSELALVLGKLRQPSTPLRPTALNSLTANNSRSGNIRARRAANSTNRARPIWQARTTSMP
jgi:hypothetical protein